MSVCESLDALLECTQDFEEGVDSDDEEEGLDTDRQALLCDSLIKSLHRLHSEHERKASRRSEDDGNELKDTTLNANNFIHTSIDYNNKRSGTTPKTKLASKAELSKFHDFTFREVFADSHGAVSRLPPLLASMMSTRVETEKILPATQDVEANEEAMGSNNAIILTRPALTAARLYSMLLSIPGALGSGLIEMEAVSSVAALFRRWRVECVTAIDQLTTGNSKAKKKKVTRVSRGKRKTGKSLVSNPIKRGHRKVTYADDVSEDEDDSSDEDSADEGRPRTNNPFSSEESDILSPSVLLFLGLEAALCLCEVPLQKEFTSWSSVAREALMDAITSVYGTVCALVTPASASKLDKRIVQLQQRVMNRAMTCVMKCIPRDDTTSSSSTVSKRHETSVFLFRGLHSVLVMREHLPNKEMGKQIAHEQVTQALVGFLKYNSEEICSKEQRRGATASKSSRKSTADVATTPKTTAKKGRKKRVSFGVMETTAARTPMLKSARKKAPAETPSYGGTKPRPVLSAVLGLMQKLSTAKGLDRATLRKNIVFLIQSLLQYLPSLERTHFLRFMNQLSRSKVPVHRLVCAELLGRVLLEPWLWEHHLDQEISTTSPVPLPQTLLPPKTPPSGKQRNLSPETEKQDEPWAVTPESQSGSIPSALLASLMGRLVDRAPAVRARASASFADLIHTVAASVQGGDGTENSASLAELRGALSLNAYSIANALRKRAMTDEKATVRKTSIDALTELMLLGTYDNSFPIGVSEEEVETLGNLCHDSSLTTRKAAAQGLSSLLARCTEIAQDNDCERLQFVGRTWCQSVTPMVLDSETGCVTKAVELVYESVIAPIALGDRDERFDPKAYRTAWMILSMICESAWSVSAKDVTPALNCTLTKLTATESGYADVTKQLLRRICNVAVQTIDKPSCELFEPTVEVLRSGVWCLFDALVDQTKNLSALYQTLKKLRIDLDFLGTSWEKLLALLETPDLSKKSTNFLQSCMKSCLRLLAKLASCVHIDVANESARNLHSMLIKFKLPPDLIGPAVSALAATSIVCSGDVSIDKVREDCESRLTSLYDKCEEVISAYAKLIHDAEEVISQADHQATIRAIYMVGEISVQGFTNDESDSKKTRKGSHQESRDASKSNPLQGINIPPRKELLDLIMAFLPGQLLGSDQTPETARAHAFTCIGKICMRAGQEQLAKKCVTIFAREIQENFKGGSPSVQSNALLVLGDLCCRYTSLVDRHLNLMAKCLQSGTDSENSITLTTHGGKSAVVRKNALLLLTSLLLQDYIKLRGLLFFRFLVASTDNDETVAQIAENILVGPLLSKYPHLFRNNAVEAVFVLNRCVHPIYLAAKSLGDGGAGISVDFEGIHLNGNAGRARREAMYSLMLRHLSDEEKIGVTARLVKEVLGSAASSSGGSLHRVCTNPKTRVDVERDLDREYDSAFNVLSDAFAILSSPLLRVGRVKAADDDQDAIEDTNPNRRIIAAKGKLLSNISRKHLIEICLPILSNLKVILQSSCSPLLKELMQYLVHIYRTYKVETKDFLANDPNLLNEIEYDEKKARKSSGQKVPEEEEGSPSS